MRRAALLAGLLLLLPLFSRAQGIFTDTATERSDEVLRDYLWEELIALPPGRRPTVGIAFSGGAARGFAHVGVIQGLENAGFPADVVAGTSMGSLVGVVFADGTPAARMRELLIGAKLTQGVNLSVLRVINLLLRDSLLSTKPVVAFINRQLGEKRFDQLKRPFGCVATDIKTGEKIVFTDGEVAPAVRASINIPGVFAPVEYRHRFLVDGGIVDFIPVDVARQLGADWVLASVTEGDYTRSTLPNVLFTMEQVIDISGSILSRRSKDMADFIMNPDVGEIKIYQMERGGEAYERGVLAAQKKVRQAQQSLLLFSAPWLAKALRGGA